MKCNKSLIFQDMQYNLYNLLFFCVWTIKPNLSLYSLKSLNPYFKVPFLKGFVHSRGEYLIYLLEYYI